MTVETNRIAPIHQRSEGIVRPPALGTSGWLVLGTASMFANHPSPNCCRPAGLIQIQSLEGDSICFRSFFNSVGHSVSRSSPTPRTKGHRLAQGCGRVVRRTEGCWARVHVPPPPVIKAALVTKSNLQR